jgi:hypothetical protein
VQIDIRAQIEALKTKGIVKVLDDSTAIEGTAEEIETDSGRGADASE